MPHRRLPTKGRAQVQVTRTRTKRKPAGGKAVKPTITQKKRK